MFESSIRMWSSKIPRLFGDNERAEAKKKTSEKLFGIDKCQYLKRYAFFELGKG